jgi:hypothetical protein
MFHEMMKGAFKRGQRGGYTNESNAHIMHANKRLIPICYHAPSDMLCCGVFVVQTRTTKAQRGPLASFPREMEQQQVRNNKAIIQEHAPDHLVKKDHLVNWFGNTMLGEMLGGGGIGEAKEAGKGGQGAISTCSGRASSETEVSANI